MEKRKDAAKPPLNSVKPPANSVHKYREELGRSKVELARAAKLSERTVARIERQEAIFRMTTYFRVLNGMNKLRGEDGLLALTYEQLYPHGPARN